MIEKIQEPIDVLASFSVAGRLVPRKFRWNGTIYEVLKVHQIHESREGKAVLLFFNCSDSASPYRKLCFNNVSRIWTLEETEADP